MYKFFDLGQMTKDENGPKF